MEHILIERMLPHEYAEGGKNLNIDYSFFQSPFGKVLVASTAKGIVCMAFADDDAEAIAWMKEKLPNARYKQQSAPIHEQALKSFSADWLESKQPIVLHVKGTDFEVKVWKALLRIPCGQLTSYGEIAIMVDSPIGARATGNAIAKNPVAYIIPCHRAIRQNGKLGGYMWGMKRKKELINWEKL